MTTNQPRGAQDIPPPPHQTKRAQDILTFLRKCVEERRDLLLQKYAGRTDANSKTKEIKETYELETILSEGATRAVACAQMATHISKGTHPDTEVKNTTNLHIKPEQFAKHSEVGTHSLQPDSLLIDATGNGTINKKAYLAYWLLQQKFEGKSILQFLERGDEDAINALHQDADTARKRANALVQLAKQKCPRPASHTLMKQVYWLVGDGTEATANAADDTQYHLLAPLYATSLAHAVHAEINDARFGEANKKASDAWREKQPHDGVYRDYRNLAARKLGGSQPQNISQLNSEQNGINYLLASLPPRWQEQSQRFPNFRSSLDHFRRHNGVNRHIKNLIEFLKTNPKSTMKPLNKRERIEQALYQRVVEFGFEIQGQHTPGWTRNADCNIQRCEQLWLDPGRAYLPPHPNHEEDDRAFAHEFAQRAWLDGVATLFAKWLYDILYKAGLPVGDNEVQRWKKQVRRTIVCATDWPATARHQARMSDETSEEPRS
jgi:CRISPR-associated protein Csy1